MSKKWVGPLSLVALFGVLCLVSYMREPVSATEIYAFEGEVVDSAVLPDDVIGRMFTFTYRYPVTLEKAQASGTIIAAERSPEGTLRLWTTVPSIRDVSIEGFVYTHHDSYGYAWFAYSREGNDPLRGDLGLQRRH